MALTSLVVTITIFVVTSVLFLKFSVRGNPIIPNIQESHEIEYQFYNPGGIELMTSERGYFDKLQTTYWISPFKANFTSALEYCHQNNMKPIKIQTADQEKCLFSFLESEKIESIWTSGNDLEQERRFRWGQNGEDFLYFNYDFLIAINTKIEDTKDCLSIQKNQTNKFIWVESLCEDTHLFACQS